MSIAATPVVRPPCAAATGREFHTEPEADSVPEPMFEPEVSRARRVAWAVVLLLGCGFSYSIGWSKGWTVGAGEADARFEAINQSMIALPQVESLQDAPVEPLSAHEPVETAAAADNGAGADAGAGRL